MISLGQLEASFDAIEVLSDGDLNREEVIRNKHCAIKVYHHFPELYLFLLTFYVKILKRFDDI